MAIVEFHLHDIGELLSWIERQGETGKKAVSYTVKDIKGRAPGWVASEVTSVYNIKKSEITPARTIENSNKKAISVSVSGETLETVSIVYRGRTLTPIHFAMSPKEPPRGEGSRKKTLKNGSKIFKKYAISFSVMKGSRHKIRGKSDYQTPFIAPNKGKDKRKGNENPVYIVFQRKGAARTNMYSVRTLSVPQMLGNSLVRDKINRKFTETATQRVQHHLDRFAPKE